MSVYVAFLRCRDSQRNVQSQRQIVFVADWGSCYTWNVTTCMCWWNFTTYMKLMQINGIIWFDWAKRRSLISASKDSSWWSWNEIVILLGEFEFEENCEPVKVWISIFLVGMKLFEFDKSYLGYRNLMVVTSLLCFPSQVDYIPDWRT